MSGWMECRYSGSRLSLRELWPLKIVCNICLLSKLKSYSLKELSLYTQDWKCLAATLWQLQAQWEGLTLPAVWGALIHFGGKQQPEHHTQKLTWETFSGTLNTISKNLGETVIICNPFRATCWHDYVVHMPSKPSGCLNDTLAAVAQVAERSSSDRKVGGSIYMSRCPWARCWTPNFCWAWLNINWRGGR